MQQIDFEQLLRSSRAIKSQTGTPQEYEVFIERCLALPITGKQALAQELLKEQQNQENILRSYEQQLNALSV